MIDGEQLSLPDPSADDIGLFQHPDAGAAETQRVAAIEEYPRTGTARLAVLRAIARLPDDYGLTDEEIQNALHLNPSTERPRRVELVTAGWVEDSGIRRPTRASGKPAAAWRLTPAGRVAFGALELE
jgi:hypothetical protein